MQQPNRPSFRDTALADVWMEREAQMQRWGIQDWNPLEWVSILTEEVGEVAEQANELHWHQHDHNPRLTETCYREELVQAAAVCVAAIEALDRGAWKEKKR